MAYQGYRLRLRDVLSSIEHTRSGKLLNPISEVTFRPPVVDVTVATTTRMGAVRVEMHIGWFDDVRHSAARLSHCITRGLVDDTLK